jgi:hypothetical protein
LGLTWSQRVPPTGSALVALPLALERPPPGTEVLLPAPLLPYRQSRGPDGMPARGLYDYRKRQWQEMTWPASVWLRLQVPPELLPLEPTEARIVARVTGPIGKLTIEGFKNGERSLVKSWTDPVGTVTGETTDRETLRLSEDGGLFLKVSGGDPDRPELTQSDPTGDGHRSYWRIESLAVELRAVVPPP